LNDCGPSDGPATTFIIAPVTLSCPPANCVRGSCAPTRPPNRDEVSIYRSLNGLSGTVVSFPATGPNGLGQASSCRDNTCVQASYVQLSYLTDPMSGAVTGMYTLTFADGATVSGSFEGMVCDSPAFCG
jgi:hypothetical protein